MINGKKCYVTPLLLLLNDILLFRPLFCATVGISRRPEILYRKAETARGEMCAKSRRDRGDASRDPLSCFSLLPRSSCTVHLAFPSAPLNRQLRFIILRLPTTFSVWRAYAVLIKGIKGKHPRQNESANVKTRVIHIAIADAKRVTGVANHSLAKK